VVIARLPLFLFQAVQAALLPKLSALVSSGRIDDFKTGFRRLAAAVAGVGLLGILGAVVLGPLVVDIAFNVDVSSRTLALLAAGSAMYMLALTMAQALIALHGQTAAAFCWLASVVVFVIVTALGEDLFLRVEMGLVAGSAVAVVSMAALVLRRTRGGAELRPDDLIEALHEIAIEP
jgi:O-antigen/teichoic acid export membrane protein